MQFIKTDTDNRGIQTLIKIILTALEANKKVLWLVSGGSNIQASVKVLAALPKDKLPFLAVLLADERYGPVGHIDSNYQQFMDASFMTDRLDFKPVLQDGLSIEETALHYAKVLDTALQDADLIVSQLGIGTDGHIAGILPHSFATEPTDSYVVSYKSDPYQRVTMTFNAFTHIDYDITLAYGANKHDALHRLQAGTEDSTTLPSIILTQVPKVMIYNDQIGEIQ
jgi:6-phosphogluconolactonase/glucosamine-6-phosphate isomerase/deaminase